MRLNQSQTTILKMFGPNTYSLEIKPSADRNRLEADGLIEWVPPKFGNHHSYGITDAGRKTLAELDS